jgi:multimeric flavodoxin WrbA
MAMDDLTRRTFLGVSGLGITGGAVAAGCAGTAAALQQGGTPAEEGIKVVAVCCSPRKTSTTAASLEVCLEAAKKAAPGVEVELIRLAGMKINGALAAGVPLEPGEKDDFPALAPKLTDARVGGIIIGTPVYFGSMSSLCKAFLERFIIFRKQNFALSGKVGGVLAVGGARNGGQELTIQSVQTALFCQEMVLVGDGRPTGHFGAAVWNSGKGPITDDEIGMAKATNLGRRVAEVALRLRGRTV